MKTQETFTIFIIEDDPDQLRMLREYIETKFLNFNVISYSTGEEALKHIKENPHLIILDHHLNSVNKYAMDGLTVLKKIKTLNGIAPVIILSAQEDPDVSARFIKAGAYDYVVKNPTSFSKLGTIIHHFSSHLILDQKIISKKLYGVLIVVAALVAFLLILFAINR